MNLTSFFDKPSYISIYQSGTERSLLDILSSGHHAEGSQGQPSSIPRETSDFISIRITNKQPEAPACQDQTIIAQFLISHCLNLNLGHRDALVAPLPRCDLAFILVFASSPRSAHLEAFMPDFT